MTDFNVFYQSAMTVAGYPAPNTLSPINPLNSPPANGADLAPGWAALGKRVIRATADATNRYLELGCNPSGGSAIGWVIQVWKWNFVETKWVKFGAQYSGTGDDSVHVQNVGNDLIYIQLVSIASGTLDVAVNNSGFQVYN